MLGQSVRKNDVHPFAVAQALLPGSYVSFETALAFHGWIPHSSSPPSAIMLFWSKRFSRVKSATHSFRALARGAGPAPRRWWQRGGVTGHAALTRFQELLGPGVIQALGDTFLSAQLGNTVHAAQAFEHDADLVSTEKWRRRRAPDILHHLLRRGLRRF
jgi:hypothetical protein